MKKLPVLGSAVLSGAVAVTALLAVVALGASRPTVKAVSNPTLKETVVVNPAGRTLYTLSGDSVHHLLCKSSECTGIWPPLSVPSRATKLRAGAGVRGALGIFRRPGGVLQVTLRGRPLYRYYEDRAPGDTNGEAIVSFGGTWHAASATAGAQMPSSSAPTSPASTTPVY